jgi:AraC family transcriptional regulator
MNQNDDLQLNFTDHEPPLEVQVVKTWRGLSVQHSRLQLPAEYEFQWDGTSHYLAYHDLILVDGEMEVLGERPVSGGDLRDQMTFVPLGQTIKGWARPADRSNAFTVVSFDPSAMAEELQIEFSAFEPHPQIYFKDDEIGATMRKLGRILADTVRPVTQLYAETVGLAAALEMTRLSVASFPVSEGRGRLSHHHSRIVQAYIEENISDDIGLDALASLTGLTRFHFARAFKSTFGEPPYKYVTRHRIEKAQNMLAGSQLPIPAIASACGFNGATQFGRAFREFVGQTPVGFRRSV